MKTVGGVYVVLMAIALSPMGASFAQPSLSQSELLPRGAWLTPPGNPCTEQYRTLDEPRGDRCLIIPDESNPPPEVRTTFINTSNGLTEIAYQVIEGMAIFEGDIILGSAEDLEAPQPMGAGLYADGEGLMRGWADCVIPYTIDSRLPNPSRVFNAMDHWSSLTCIQFVPQTTETSFVTIRPATSGCSSSVGRRGGQQFVNLGSGCSTGATIHELGHTVGLYHEQARADRDSTIVIHFEHIRPGLESQFRQYTVGEDYGDYDIGSIMQYGSFAFSRDGQPTITLLDGSTFTTQRRALSDTDVFAVGSMYTF